MQTHDSACIHMNLQQTELCCRHKQSPLPSDLGAPFQLSGPPSTSSTSFFFKSIDLLICRFDIILNEVIRVRKRKQTTTHLPIDVVHIWASFAIVSQVCDVKLNCSASEASIFTAEKGLTHSA